MTSQNIHKPLWKRILIRSTRVAALTICLGWVFFTLGLWLFQEKLVFLADSSPPRTDPSRGNVPFERHRVTTSDGEELDVWWMPQAGGPAIFCHGNAGNLADRMVIFQYLHRAGFQVLAFDYRGYGSSSGKPSEEGLYRDADAVWQFATENIGIPSENGFSTDGASAVVLPVTLPHCIRFKHSY